MQQALIGPRERLSTGFRQSFLEACPRDRGEFLPMFGCWQSLDEVVETRRRARHFFANFCPDTSTRKVRRTPWLSQKVTRSIFPGSERIGIRRRDDRRRDKEDEQKLKS
ncbi:MAG: hypothetical protein IPP19_04255 [Verrucomicrobia bacterium]|nr:hypothetical protein [Verrucomicrobiota bacterium]